VQFELARGCPYELVALIRSLASQWHQPRLMACLVRNRYARISTYTSIALVAVSLPVR
jgi:hypothetical protein